MTIKNIFKNLLMSFIIFALYIIILVLLAMLGYDSINFSNGINYIIWFAIYLLAYFPISYYYLKIGYIKKINGALYSIPLLFVAIFLNIVEETTNLVFYSFYGLAILLPDIIEKINKIDK
jgi:hypothetical protein